MAVVDKAAGAKKSFGKSLYDNSITRGAVRQVATKLPGGVRSWAAGFLGDWVNGPEKITGSKKTAIKASTYSNLDWRCKLKWDDLDNIATKTMLDSLPGRNTIIWPYTPEFQITYAATYDPIKTLQTNYATPAYQGSDISNISISGLFTASTVAEANYLYAVIHFLKSATRGFNVETDAKYNGKPPPILKLTYLGEGGIQNMPVVITQFNMTYPKEVDYVQCVPFTRNTEIDTVTSGSTTTTTESLIEQVPSMVPSEVNIAITLMPTYSRADFINSEYSTTRFIKGELLSKGYF